MMIKMKKEKSWLEEIKFDAELDYRLEENDHYYDFKIKKVRFPSDDEEEVIR